MHLLHLLFDIIGMGIVWLLYFKYTPCQQLALLRSYLAVIVKLYQIVDSIFIDL